MRASPSPSTSTDAPPDRVDLGATAAYDYALPAELIATAPASRREESRLLELPVAGPARHGWFRELPERLRAGDVLVRNVSRVVPARLHGRKPSGGRCELLLLGPERGTWAAPEGRRLRALGKASKGLKPGARVLLEASDGAPTAVALTIASPHADTPAGELTVELPEDLGISELLARFGRMPLPPYIRRARRERGQDEDTSWDHERYQTVYAAQPGSVAAPTAGLHATDPLIEALRDRGVRLVDVTLEVGIGTFRPVECERLADHPMHAERYQVSEEAAAALRKASASGSRVLAWGTTALRVLEDQARRGGARAGCFETDIFVHPGSPPSSVAGLVTNFHLPRSSLLALVCALGGYERVMAAYAEAIERGYRFYSYGDASLIWAATGSSAHDEAEGRP
jgi:S-adenosylmethionine:tRNA ribosyltransferase-isomerase